MAGPNIYHLLTALTLLLLTTLFLRILTLIPSILPRPPPSPPTPKTSTHILILLGSGGHTAEMLSMLRSLNPTTYPNRTYIVSSGDTFSASKAVAFEESLLSKHGPEKIGRYCIRTIPRARKIHQGLGSTIFTSLKTFYIGIQILCTDGFSTSAEKEALKMTYPNIILTNGPGTAVILILASLLLKFINWKGAWTSGFMRTVYVESWARCSTLSLTGRLLVGIVDRVLVQWEGLEGVGGRGEFRGVLVE